MQKKTITKEYYVLDTDDIENAVSKFYGKKYTLEDLNVIVYDKIDYECFKPGLKHGEVYYFGENEMSFEIRIDGEKECLYSSKLFQLCGVEDWGFQEGSALLQGNFLHVDSDLFKSYDRHVIKYHKYGKKRFFNH